MNKRKAKWKGENVWFPKDDTRRKQIHSRHWREKVGNNPHGKSVSGTFSLPTDMGNASWEIEALPISKAKDKRHRFNNVESLPTIPDDRIHLLVGSTPVGSMSTASKKIPCSKYVV